jgi:polyhydroxybutyrate depolymerase
MRISAMPKKSSAILFVTLLAAYNSLFSHHAFAGEAQVHQLLIDGNNREYIEYRPANINHSTPVPLVIVLHGGFGSDSQAEKSYGWDELADRQGFIVAYPNGLSRSWNAGNCCGPAAKDKVDDLGFLTSVIKDISHNENFDSKKVYMTGMSNGGVLAYRYACEGGFPIAAIGPVAGGLSSGCENPHALSVIEIHGLADQHIPIDGGYGSKGVAKVDWLPLHQTLDKFRRVGNCQAAVSHQNGVVETSLSACASGNEVELITIAGAGHQWPGGGRKKSPVFERLFGSDEPSTAIDATSVIWAFFQRL